MKYPLRVMGLVTAIAVTSAILPEASAQAAARQIDAYHRLRRPNLKRTPARRPRCVKGAVLRVVTCGSAAKGAVVGAGHSRREDRRTERKNK